MAWTTTDLTNIETAIATLSTGVAVTQVTFANGHSIRYRESDLQALLSLRSMIQSELGVVHRRAYAKQGGRAKL